MLNRALFYCVALSAIQLARAQPVFTEYSVPTASSGPLNITPGPDGALWFTESRSGKIGRITTSGVFTEYALPAGYQPGGITAGPDGALWFTSTGPDAIIVGRITTSGTITQYQLPVAVLPDYITPGPDGALWFNVERSKIGRITTAGALSFFTTPAASGGPLGIISGLDGALWFTGIGVGAINRITTAGVVTQFPEPNANGNPNQITVGRDGALWVTLEYGIARITTAGIVSEFAAPQGELQGITCGPDGALWYTEWSANNVTRISTSGVFTQFKIPTIGSEPWGITTGPDGALWFTERNVGKIGRLVPSMAPSVLTGGIVNAASYAAVNGVGSPVAPGALVAIFTSPLAAQSVNYSTASLPSSLGGVSVTFNNIAAPMVSVSPSGAYPFISAQVPSKS
jgi:virginiamycin B lyase